MGKSLQFEWPISHSTSNKIDSIFVNIYQAHLEAASAWKQTHKERPETSLHVTLKDDIYGHKNIRLCLDKSQVIGRVGQKKWNAIHVLVNLVQQTFTFSTRGFTWWRCCLDFITTQIVDPWPKGPSSAAAMPRLEAGKLRVLAAQTFQIYPEECQLSC